MEDYRKQVDPFTGARGEQTSLRLEGSLRQRLRSNRQSGDYEVAAGFRGTYPVFSS
jgi:hypothetical protein